ncbi:MAG TPA: ABC transporter permease [Patescibacteria group bacterium]|nr:ABC transporter permease [Patescibacteria group bacterium]
MALAREDLRLTLRERSSIFWIFIAPFLWVAFFGTFNRPQDPAQLKIALSVIEQEDTPMAERLVQGLEAENFRITVVKPGQTVATGDDAPPRTLTIPAGFGEAIAQRRKVSLELREARGASPDGTFAARIALHRAIVRLLGAEAMDGFDPAQDAVTVAASWGGGRQMPSGRYQTIPGNLVMFVLIATVTYGAALLASERRQGILRRLAVSPMRRWELIAGKALGRIAVALVQVGVFVLMSLTIFRIEWGSSPIGLALLVLAFVCAAAAIGMLGGTLFSSPDAASGVGIVVVLAMSALGGCWWPSEVMPGWLRQASFIFPTAWAMNGLHELLSWGGGVREVRLHCLVLALYAACAGALATYRLGRAT